MRAAQALPDRCCIGGRTGDISRCRRTATDAATRAATDAATRAATLAATRAATDAATRAATDAATLATYVATYDATRAATDVATRDATRAATDDATRATTEAAVAIDSDAWYTGIGDMMAVARALSPGQEALLLACARRSYAMWNGGNQYSAWASYLSFFRHVAGIDLPQYEQWQHYEAAAEHGGPRIMHEEFCIVSDRPEVLTVDDENRPHNDHGPFCRWRDGTALYAVHGVYVPWWVIEHPDRLTAARITNERNAEVRRVMLDRYGVARYLLDIKAETLDRSDYGTLYRAEFEDDEPLVMVRVTNSTAEPDGSFKDYWLRVDPQLRPLLADGTFGTPQEMRARNAVASTFGLRGEEYHPEYQT